MVKRKIVIEHSAKLSLKKAYEFIRKDSNQNAEKVKDKILQSIKLLEINPERHAPDKFCIDNGGCFRAYEIFRYRITYHISISTITVIRIRHSKMNPIIY
jgi:plasmid stabilization system protein ParE